MALLPLTMRRLYIVSLFAGGDSEDHEDAEADHERPTTDGAGRDPQEHVPAFQEDDQGTD